MKLGACYPTLTTARWPPALLVSVAILKAIGPPRRQRKAIYTAPTAQRRASLASGVTGTGGGLPGAKIHNIPFRRFGRGAPAFFVVAYCFGFARAAIPRYMINSAPGFGLFTAVFFFSKLSLEG